MLSKYILNSNWSTLSGSYKYDKNITLSNSEITIDGNLNLTYTPYLSNLKDYANNNYSLLFLTKESKITDIINSNRLAINQNRQICLIANRMDGNFVGENTTFLNLKNNIFSTNNLTSISDDNFFEIDFLSSNELLLITTRNRIEYYMCVDDINLTLSVIEKNQSSALTSYQLDKAKMYYIYDSLKKNIIIYKIIQNEIFVLSFTDTNSVILQRSNLNSFNEYNIFTILKLQDIPGLKLNLNIVDYKKDIDKDNLNINNTYSINNNFIAHIEYNNIYDVNTNVNFITLKNQLNVEDRYYNDSHTTLKRSYKSLFGGGNREEGYENINLGYVSSQFPMVFKSDKITWFHAPNSDYKYSQNLNDSLFVKHGAIAGVSPIYSDKIFKKAASYPTASNLGSVKDIENTGIWLCAWLSAGSSENVWIDRFYNQSSFTPYEALTYSTNVPYTPEYEGKRGEGITDIKSTMTLEPGAWYAYSRLGKKTSYNILSGLTPNLVENKFSSFKNTNKLNRIPALDSDDEPIYNFSEDSYGLIYTEKLTNYNNFGISFFATRENWNVKDDYFIFGNYIDSGFGLFNNNGINPLNFYYNNKMLYILNNKFQKILTIDCGSFLTDQDFTIAGLFRRDFLGNFHVITDKNNLLEFNSNGTLVDSLSIVKTGSSVIKSINNNLNYGVVHYSDDTVLKINLFSNIITDITSSVIQTKDFYNNINNKSIIIDSFDYVYLVDGLNPINKGVNIYYRNLLYNTIELYNTNTATVSTYLSAYENIYSYNFDQNQNTILLHGDKFSIYDTFGQYLTSTNITTNAPNITAVNINYQNLGKSHQGNIHFVDGENKNYLYNITNNTFNVIDSEVNLNYSLSANLYYINNDLSNWNYIQNIIDLTYPLPNYNFKVRLFNQFNYEDVKILNVNILGESLNTGTHHFVFNLDTLNGYFNFYIDGRLYNTQYFDAKKYSFSPLFNNTITVGTLPFYGGLIYSEFYKSSDFKTFINDLVVEKFKFYNIPLNPDEIKLLYYQKYPPRDLHVDLNMGERNYIDTISRTFRHKMQGSKSNLINLIINDSLITDKKIQKNYEMLIIKKLSNVLPGYVRINSIKWQNNKNSNEKMLEGNFNVRNTLTNNIE